MAQAEEAAVKYGGDAFKEYVKKNGIPKSAEHAKSLESMSFKNLELQERLTRDANELEIRNAELKISKARLSMEKEGKKAQGQELFQGSDGKLYLWDKTSGKAPVVPEGVKLYKVGTERAPSVMKKGEFQANFISEIINQQVDPDTSAKIAAAQDYKNKLKHLQELNTGLGSASGLKVSMADSVNKYLASKAGPHGTFEKADLDAAYDDLQNDKSFSALSAKSKEVAKNELDAVMAYLKTKYGNRAPVADFKAAQQLLSRSNMTSLDYNRILNNEIKSANTRLSSIGLKPQQILSLDARFAKNESDLDLLLSGEDEVAKSSVSDNVTGLPATNSKGWVLHGDGKGNYAYVSPNGKDFEEVK
jgi:hypothetical protein